MSRRGFSWIELITVFVLIGVIAAIGLPRLRDGLDTQSVRCAKALIATMAATARGAAIQRGCAATLNMTVDSAWVTACGVNPPAANVQVGRSEEHTSELQSRLHLVCRLLLEKKKKKKHKSIHAR